MCWITDHNEQVTAKFDEVDVEVFKARNAADTDTNQGNTHRARKTAKAVERPWMMMSPACIASEVVCNVAVGIDTKAPLYCPEGSRHVVEIGNREPGDLWERGQLSVKAVQ